MSEKIVTAAVLVIGDEILSGRTKDRNIGCIAEYLANIGVDLREARVVPDIEDEIVQREARVEEFHRELADPAVVRDGQRVRRLKAEIEEEQAALKTLYAHWDEATELNW